MIVGYYNSSEHSLPVRDQLSAACRDLHFELLEIGSAQRETPWPMHCDLAIVHGNPLICPQAHPDLRLFLENGVPGWVEDAARLTPHHWAAIRISSVIAPVEKRAITFHDGAATRRRYLLHVPQTKATLKDAEDWKNLLRCLADKEKLERYLNGTAADPERDELDNYFEEDGSGQDGLDLFKALAEGFLALAAIKGDPRARACLAWDGLCESTRQQLEALAPSGSGGLAPRDWYCQKIDLLRNTLAVEVLLKGCRRQGLADPKKALGLIQAARGGDLDRVIEAFNYLMPPIEV